MNNIYYTLKIYFRNFKKQKLIYSITIGGFALSLAVLVLISSYIIEEKSVDKHFPNIENMYRIKQNDDNAQIPKRMYHTILNVAPEIEKLCLINKKEVLYEYGDEKKTAQAVSTNEEFLDVFSVEILKGKQQNLLQSKSSVLITQKFAEAVFGSEDPIGKIIEFESKEKKEVRAVIANSEETSSLKYDVIFNLDQDMYHSTMGYNEETYYMHDAVFLSNPQADWHEIEKKLSDILKPFEGYNETLLKIQPFREIYFDLKSSNDCYAHANLSMIKLLSLIALIILLLAVFNFVNLTTAFNNERHKEICIRKTSGARNKTVLYQFIKESYLSALIAMMLAVFLANLLAPLFKELFNRELSVFDALKTPQVLIAVISIFFFVGCVTSIIPAFVVSKFNPIDLLQKRTKLKNANIRGVFNTIQILVTISLIICLIVITKQIHYVKTKDVGFNKNFLLEVSLQGKTQAKATEIKEKLLQYPQILDVSGSHGIPFSTRTSSTGSWRNNGLEYRLENITTINTDTSFLSTFGLKLITGRNFRPTDKDAIIINKKTYDHLELDGIEGKSIWNSEIVGVVEDFHFKKMYSEIGLIQLNYSLKYVSHLNIRISGKDIPESLDKIQTTLKEFDPGITFEPRFYDDWINTMYQKEENQAKAIKIYAIMALILSCLGLLGMAEFSTKKRTKEIGVRKVNGAKTAQVLYMLNTDFIKWVSIAFILSCPAAYFFMNKWLENFAYKTDISWWIFALAGLFTLMIAMITVSWQSWQAANKNPVKALRHD